MMATYEEKFIEEIISYDEIVAYLIKTKLTNTINFNDLIYTNDFKEKTSSINCGRVTNSMMSQYIKFEFIQYLNHTFYINAYRMIPSKNNGRGINETWELLESPQHGFIDRRIWENHLFFKDHVYNNPKTKLYFFEWLSQKLDKSILELCFEIKHITVKELKKINILEAIVTRINKTDPEVIQYTIDRLKKSNKYDNNIFEDLDI